MFTVSGELLTLTQNDGVTDIVTFDHDTKASAFKGKVGIGYSSPGQKLQVAEANNYSPPGLGSNGGHVGIFKIDSGVPKYGMITGVESSGKVFQQVQRIDGAATAYDLLLQPSGGNVGIGTSTNFNSLNGRRLSLIHI